MAEDSGVSTAEPYVLPTARPRPFDLPPDLARVRAEQPLQRLAYPDGHVGWLVTSYALARTVLDEPRFSARLDLKRSPVERPGSTAFMGRTAPPGMFIGMDPPEHTRYRSLLTRVFSARRMKELSPRIEQIVDQRLDAMEAAGPPADLVPAFSLPVPVEVISELMGAPEAQREALERNAATFVSLNATPEQVGAAIGEISGSLMELVRQKRKAPGNDVLSDLTESDLTDEELVGIAMLLLAAGHETTANMLALGTYALLREEDQRAALTADPGLLDNAVEELMRYLTVVQYSPTRAPLEDTELDGQLIKAGETITVSLPAANRDPERFENPEKLDVTAPPTAHLAFGHGLHLCLGQQLARIEMRIGFQKLFARFPGLRLAAAPEEIPMREDMNTYGVHRLPVAW
ncbi:cytochrome P450 [Streptomyces reniochalinae]|uniref:Cytochrome P450 n=1 Tax=Streptomyces reniochalinae TaxID=2250578 RepID=A0A367EDL8_9ACTN|nr:cytochrome P450 [Streptomyces reniochalinae]RCG15735.1 cytochrome P450 [Streptomyces reniochalinae]